MLPTFGAAGDEMKVIFGGLWESDIQKLVEEKAIEGFKLIELKREFDNYHLMATFEKDGEVQLQTCIKCEAKYKGYEEEVLCKTCVDKALKELQ